MDLLVLVIEPLSAALFPLPVTLRAALSPVTALPSKAILLAVVLVEVPMAVSRVFRV